MRRLLLLLAAAGLSACAPARTSSRGDAPPVAAAAATGNDDSMGSGGGGGPEHDPEIVRTGKAFKIGYGEAVSRYGKGSPCAGDASPEAVVGPPDQRNQMQQGKDKVVTYGFRFREGTLLIRCRGDRVEVQRTLK
jgi:hypothetical protein